MAKRQLNCSDKDYIILKRLRNHLISAEILHKRFENEAKEYMKMGLNKRALFMQKMANYCLEVVREIEDEIEELERLCFGRRESP